MRRRDIPKEPRTAEGPLHWKERWAHRIYFLIKVVSVCVYRKKWFQPPENATFSAREPRHFHRRPWTAPIMLLGDNQLQHELGDPDSISNMFDRWSEPSTRPPLTMLFGHALLEDQLKHNAQLPAALPLLHMGDAINTSCRSEFDRFRASVLRAKREWYPDRAMRFAMLPGNHDGFFLGNLQPRQRSLLSSQTGFAKLWRLVSNSQGVEWRCRCSDAFREQSTALGPFTKNDFIEEYFDLLESLYDSGRLRRRTARGRIHLLFTPQPEAASFLCVALGYIDIDNPQRSFLLQIVRLPVAEDAQAGDPVPFMMILDTSNYRGRPRNAGMQGSIGRMQVKHARKLWNLIRRRKGQGAAPHVLTFGLHHNLHALSVAGRGRFEDLALALDRRADTCVLPFCISAHRHRGGWYAHAQSCREGFGRSYLDWVELNTSSMVDWPLAVRDMRIWMPAKFPDSHGRSRHHFVVESNQRVFATHAQLDAQLDNNTNNGIGAACRAIVGKVVEQRTSRLRQDPVRRAISVFRDPVRDAYVAEYEILFDSAASLQIVLTNPTFMESAKKEDCEQARSQALAQLKAASAIDPMNYLDAYAKSWFDPVETFCKIRMAVKHAHAAIEELRVRAPEVNDLLVKLILHSVREDYYSQWRSNKYLPAFIADRWYRCASNIEERFSLVRMRRGHIA